jgi:hypothetical protein
MDREISGVDGMMINHHARPEINRHPELVSGSMNTAAAGLASSFSWMLKQVQHDASGAE